MAQRNARQPAPRPCGGEAGFTVVETVVALAVIFVVLTGSIATYAASVRNTVGGRHRTEAVTVAREVVEEARAALYSQVGHDLGGDTTLAGDPELSGTTPLTFEGQSLVGAATPIYPQHEWTVDRGGKSYTVRAYVTWMSPAGADPYKRLTVVVTWDSPQHPSALINNEVRVSSYLFPAAVPPDPLLEGAGDADGPVFQTTGTVGGLTVQHAAVAQPLAAAGITSLFTRSTMGSARSSTTLVQVTNGTLTGCEVDTTGTEAECPGVRADAATDSDAATYHPEHDVNGPHHDGSYTVSSGGPFSVAVGANDSVRAWGTARSCFDCYPSDIGDDDRLAYQWSEGKGPGSVDVLWDSGPVDGSLMKFSGLSQSTATLDQDAVSSSHKMISSSRSVMPAVDVVTVTDGPSGFAGAVRVGTADVTAAAEAGPTAVAPSISGADVSVSIYDTLSGGSLGYRSVSLTPGEDYETAAEATFTVNGATVTLTTTVASGGRTLSSQSDSSGALTHAEASLTNWLRIEVHLVVTDASGTVADLVTDVDYGRIAARADYEAP